VQVILDPALKGIAGDISPSVVRGADPSAPWTITLKVNEDKELVSHVSSNGGQRSPSECSAMRFCNRGWLPTEAQDCPVHGDDEVIPKDELDCAVVAPAMLDGAAVATDFLPDGVLHPESKADPELPHGSKGHDDGSKEREADPGSPNNGSKDAEARQAARALLQSNEPRKAREPQRKVPSSHRKQDGLRPSFPDGPCSPASRGLQPFLDNTPPASAGPWMDGISSPFNTLDYEEMTRNERHDARALLKDFVKTMVRGRHLSVIDGDGRSRHCFCSMGRKLDRLKISLNRNDETSRDVHLSCIEEILPGSQGREGLDASLDECLVTLKLDSRDLITLRMPDVEARDKFVICLKMFSIQLLANGKS